MEKIDLGKFNFELFDVCFFNSKLKNIESEYILSRFIKLAKENDKEIVSTFTFEEYWIGFNNGNIMPLLTPTIAQNYFKELQEKGYIKVHHKEKTISTTKQFYHFCKDYLERNK